MNTKIKLSTKRKRSKPLAPFSKSFKQKVRLPNNGKPCTFQRHYCQALKLIINKYDWLAGNDTTGERFVYAKWRFFQRECLDSDTRKQFDKRTIMRCNAYLLDRGIITRAEPRVRKGALQTGVIVAEHNALFEIIGNYCIFCGQMSPQMSPESPKDVTNDVTNDVTEKTSNKQASIGDSSTGTSSFASDFASDNASLGYKSMTKASITREHLSLFKPSDLTVARAMPYNSDTHIETILDRITDGEFETGTLIKVHDIAELKDACLRAIRYHGKSLFRSRYDCLKIVGRVMDEMQRDNMKRPPGLLKCKTILSAGGALRRESKTKVDAFDGALSVFPKLTSLEVLMNAAAVELGVPGSWSEAVTFLTTVKERLEQTFMEVPSELIQGLAYFEARAEDRVMSASSD